MVRSAARKAASLGLAAAVAACSAGKAPADYGRAEGPVIGLQAVHEPLPWFDSERNYPAYDGEIRDLAPNRTVAATSVGRPPMDSPVALRLSRFRHPVEDGHLDALVRFDMNLGQRPQGSLDLAMLDAEGNVVSQATVEGIPGSQLHFSYRFPQEMAGASGELSLTWRRPGADDAEASASFQIAPSAGAARSGRLRLTVPNDSGAVLPAAPMTAGVPFPRGALDSTENLRLVDEQGREVPLQANEVARWSRFGGVKWAHCDFTLDLEGGPREVFLEYGPDVSRVRREDLRVSAGDGAPSVEAGNVRLGPEGVEFDPAGDGDFRTVLGAEALAGAFVEHSRGANYVDFGHRYMSTRGKSYTMGAPEFSVEESGPEKAVLRAQGWYANPVSGERFCQYVVRYVVHRGSPVVRIFHTWIYTGDGTRDSVRNMGWRFPLEGMAPMGFLSSFEDGAPWLEGYYLRQHDPDEYALFEHEVPRRTGRVTDEAVPARPIRQTGAGTRASGVMAAQGKGVRVYVGVQDFWQNFPNSLMLEDDAMTFFQWPRYGRARRHHVSAEDAGNVWRLWFVHEGEVLNFRLPQALTEAPLYVMAAGPEPHYDHGLADSINAQGIAKTAEMWLYLTADDADPALAVRALRGLHEESMRAVVDPQWMAASGAFYEIAAAAPGTYPALERLYEESTSSVIRQSEHMGVYGKWIYGDLLRPADLEERTAGMRRTFRKAHWGWPFSWTPFVRSGDLGYLRFAQAATRMMSDTAFCHYVGEGLERFFAEELEPRQIWASLQPYRRIGWHEQNLIPWAGYWGPMTRGYVDQADYLWDAWYVTGYHRAKDVALAWAEQTKVEEADKIFRGPITAASNRTRWSANLQKQYVEMYEATWDPWFLAAAQAIADLHLWRFREENFAGHFWLAGYQTWQRYSGCPEHKRFVLRNAEHWADWHQQGWASAPTTIIVSSAFGYYLTGEEHYLRRLAGVADLMKWALFRGDGPDFYRGFYVRSSGTDWHMNFTSWAHIWFPYLLEAFERAGGVPERPLPFAFNQTFTSDCRVAVRKTAREPLALRTRGRFAIIGPDGRTFKEGQAPEAVIAADAPAGTYIVALPGRNRRPMLPLSPPDTPEVYLPGETVPFGADFAQHWFMVHAGTDSFWIEFDNTPYFRQSVRQIIVWNPDGEEAWAHIERENHHDPTQETIRAEVRVAPEHGDRLWRLTMPGMRSMPFRLGPNLPRILSHDPWRWFAPR